MPIIFELFKIKYLSYIQAKSITDVLVKICAQTVLLLMTTLQDYVCRAKASARSMA